MKLLHSSSILESPEFVISQMSAVIVERQR
jgi:hypothetical protein